MIMLYMFEIDITYSKSCHTLNINSNLNIKGVDIMMIVWALMTFKLKVAIFSECCMFALASKYIEKI